MGDTGSLLIGLVNAILVVKFINLRRLTNVFLSDRCNHRPLDLPS